MLSEGISSPAGKYELIVKTLHLNVNSTEQQNTMLNERQLSHQ